MYRTLAIALLAMLEALVPIGAADELRKFFGPTGHPYSGYVGTVEAELGLIRLHFDLADDQIASLSSEIDYHRMALKRMDSLHYTLDFQHTIDQSATAGGYYAMIDRNPEFGPLQIAAYNKLLGAQAELEEQLIERIRLIIEPNSTLVWDDYLMTRDFERWRQPSWHESLGETIDPMLLLQRVQPGLIDDPKAEQTLRDLRKEAHRLASQLVLAYQRDELDSIQVVYRVKVADPEKSDDLHEQALVAAFELASYLWTIPDHLAVAGFDVLEARRYRVLFTEQQGLVSKLNGLTPIEDRIAGALFVRDALALPNLKPEQRDRLSAMWSEMQEAYTRASDIDYKFNDAWMRVGGLYDRPDYPSEVYSIFREVGKDPDEIASVLTLPQWYEVVRDNEFWGRSLYEYHPDYETFDWWSLDFESLIPE